MTPDPPITVILFEGFNEVALPRDAQLADIETDGYEISLLFKSEGDSLTGYRQFYLAFNSAPTDYSQGILRLLGKIDFPDGTSTAMIYEVYPYVDEETEKTEAR